MTLSTTTEIPSYTPIPAPSASSGSQTYLIADLEAQFSEQTRKDRIHMNKLAGSTLAFFFCIILGYFAYHQLDQGWLTLVAWVIIIAVGHLNLTFQCVDLC
jgi:hypothetical protein